MVIVQIRPKSRSLNKGANCKNTHEIYYLTSRQCNLMLRQFGKTNRVGENKEVNKICGCCEENCCCPRPCCCSAVSRLRLRVAISHSFLSRIFISHILSRIFISHFLSRIFYLASRIFFTSRLAFLSRISHFSYLASRIFMSHRAFFISHLTFLSPIYLAFPSRLFLLMEG